MLNYPQFSHRHTGREEHPVWLQVEAAPPTETTQVENTVCNTNSVVVKTLAITRTGSDDAPWFYQFHKIPKYKFHSSHMPTVNMVSVPTGS